MNDYNEDGEFVEETELKYLGQFSYSGFTVAWKDFTDYQLPEKVLRSAMRKYGRNIALRNITISDGHAAAITATSITAAAGITMMALGMEEKQAIRDGKTVEETNFNTLGGTGIGIMLASPVFAVFFKRYKITADVYEDNKIYKPSLRLIDKDDLEDEIEDRQKEKKRQEEIRLAEEAAQRRKEELRQEEEKRAIQRQIEKQLAEEMAKKREEERIALEQLEKQKREEKISRHEIWLGMTKDELIRSRGKPIKAIVKEDGIVEDSARVREGTWKGDAAASTSTLRSNRIQVYYYKEVEIYIKNNIVTEIYDIIN